MNTGLLIGNITVTRQGQRQIVELLLPGDAAAVIGIETSVNNVSVMMAPGHNQFAGVLRIHSDTPSRLCYQAEVSIARSVFETTVAGFPSTSNPELTELWTAPFCGNRYIEPERIHITGCTTLMLDYTDEIAAALAIDINYTVSIYVWYLRP